MSVVTLIFFFSGLLASLFTSTQIVYVVDDVVNASLVKGDILSDSMLGGVVENGESALPLLVFDMVLNATLMILK